MDDIKKERESGITQLDITCGSRDWGQLQDVLVDVA